MSALRVDDHDDMPGLQNVSDSDASDSDFDRDSDEDFMDDTDDARPRIIVNPFASLPARHSHDSNDHEGDEGMPGLEPIAPPTASSSTAPQPTTTPLAAPMPVPRFAASQSESVSRPRSSHRRARVESDDEGDTDRDRRHPFQRTGTGVGLGATAGTTTAQTGGTANDDYRRFFEAALGGSRMNNPANPTQGVWAAPTHPLFANIGRNTQPNAQDPGQPDRISISIDLGTVLTGPGHGVHVHRPTPPNQSAGPGVPGVGIGAAAGGTRRMPWMNMGPAPGTGEAAQGQNTAGADGVNEQGQPNPDEPISFGEFLTRMIGGRAGLNLGPGLFPGGGGLEQLLNSLRGVPEREDPERARRLVDGLEDVPVGLVRRLERVAALGSFNGEETGAVGGDSGCAICWDRLLDPPGEGPEAPEQEKEQTEEEGEAVSKDTGSSSVATEPQASTSTAEEPVANSSSSSSTSKKNKPKYPRIVTLPCAHVFHAECLIPWFTRPRQTTCPTCRFNIDPENLTATPVRRSQRATTGNDANQQRSEADGADLGPAGADIATPPPPSGALPRWGLPESIPQHDLPDLGPENAQSGLQWFPVPLPPGPGGGAGFSIMGLGMSTAGPIRTRSRSRQTTVRRSAQPYTTQSSSGPAGIPGDSSSSGSRDNPASSSSGESSSAQAGASTSNGTGDSSASSSTAEMPSSSSSHLFSSSTSNSEGSSNSNLTTNAPAAPQNRPDAFTNSGPAPNDIRGIAQAMLRMLGLQGIVDPSHVNVSGIPGQPGSGNATRATPASSAAQNPGNAAAAGHNDQQNGQDGAARNAATNPTPDPGTNAGQPGHHQWSIGLDLVFGPGPPPSVIPAGMPPVPGGVRPGEDNEEFEDDIGDGMVMMDMDMMFGPEDGGHPPIPHIHHFHHRHHHHHDHDEHDDDDEDDDHDHDHGAEGDLAAFQRMVHTVMGIPFPNMHPPPQSADAPATTAANPVNSTPQNSGNGPGLIFPMPDIPAVQMTGGNVGDLLRAFAGTNRTQNIASRHQQGTPALSQLQTSTTGTPGAASTSNQPTPPPPASGPSAFSHMRTRAAPSQTQPTSSLPGEINRLFGNVPPIRPPAATSSGSERVHSPFVTAPWASAPTSSSSQTAPSMQATSAVSPGTPAPSSQSNNAQSSGSQSAAEASRPEQQSQRRQHGRGHPATQPTGADIDEGPLGRLFRSLSGLPMGPSNGAVRPTGLGGGGLLSGDAAIPGLATHRATRATDGGQARQQRKWTPPPAPGLTLRQRIEKKEREAGLRCWDPSCGIGPSDEDPFVEVDEAARRQVRIRTNASSSQEGQSEPSEEIRYVCDHTFHPSCLVSAQRVALRGAEENVIGDSVEVSCPVCRSTGLISRADWEEGAQAL